MKHYAGLDLSVKETSIYIVDDYRISSQELPSRHTDQTYFRPASAIRA